MKKLTLKYNPYSITTEISVDGQQPKMDSSLHVGHSRLQEWADQLPGWLVKEYNERNWDVQFTGTEDDYADLQEGFALCKATHGVTAKFSIRRMPGVDEAEKVIDQIFADIQKGPVKDLKSPQIKSAFEKAKNQEFEINVVATMSSGKSTLINSLLGCERMPSAMEATTATIVRIVDDDQAKTFSAKAYNASGKLVKSVKDVSLEQMQEMNKNEDIALIEMVGPIPFVSSSGMKLVLVDTPGPNNSRNTQHEEMTYRMMADSEKSLVLFVLNAQQLGVNDERIFLDYVCNCMNKGGKQSKDRFLFVVNKINCYDPQPKHDGPGCIKKALDGVKKDLENRGIRNPNIFPVAALPALQLREEDRYATALISYRMISNDFEEMYFDQYADYSHLPPAQQKFIEDCKKDATPEELLEIRTGIFSLEQAINLYVKKYARTTKVMDLVQAFNSKLEELSAEASLQDLLRKDQASKAEMEKQIKQVRKNIETARTAKTFSVKVDKLDLVSQAQSEVKTLFKGLRTDISKMMAGRETNVEISKARLQCAEIEKQCRSMQAQLQVQVEKIIVDTYKNTVEDIITEYKQYLKDLNMGSQSEGLKLNPLKLVGSEISKMNITKLMQEHSETIHSKDVKVETYTVNSGYDKAANTFGGAFSGGILGVVAGIIAAVATGGTGFLVAAPILGAIWGGSSGAKEGDSRKSEVKTRTIELPKTTTYVNMNTVASEFLQPLQVELATTEKAVLDYVKQETVEVKSFISRKLQAIEKVLESKLNTLSHYETSIKEKDAAIADLQKQLKWLAEIEKRVNAIVKF